MKIVLKYFEVLCLLIIFSLSARSPICDTYIIAGHAGLAPTIWTNRGDFFAISCTADTILDQASILTLFKIPKFSSLFKTPWIIGARFGYTWCQDFEVYLESNYRQAGGRKFNLPNLVIPTVDTITFILDMKKYRAVDAYLGVRYYGQSCGYDWLTWFIGGKFGFLHHYNVDFIFTTNSVLVPNPVGPFVSGALPFFIKSTTPSGGVDIGFEVGIGCNCYVTMTGQIIATCGPKGSLIPFDVCTTGIAINPSLAPNGFMIGSIRTELFFPITLGLKYYF